MVCFTIALIIGIHMYKKKRLKDQLYLNCSKENKKLVNNLS